MQENSNGNYPNYVPDPNLANSNTRDNQTAYSNPQTSPIYQNYQPNPQHPVNNVQPPHQVPPINYSMPNPNPNPAKLTSLVKKKSILKSNLFPWVLFAMAGALLIIAMGGGFFYRNKYLVLNKSATTAVELATKQAKIEQADADRATYQRKIDQEYVLYEASNEYGNFTFEMPKNWSKYQNQDSLISLLMHNDLIKSTSSRFGLRVKLLDSKYNDKVKELDKQFTTGKDYQAKNGIPARSYVGAIDKEGNLGQVTIFQNRDKTLLIQTDFTSITRYQEVYDYVVASVDINK